MHCLRDRKIPHPRVVYMNILQYCCALVRSVVSSTMRATYSYPLLLTIPEYLCCLRYCYTAVPEDLSRVRMICFSTWYISICSCCVICITSTLYSYTIQQQYCLSLKYIVLYECCCNFYSHSHGSTVRSCLQNERGII